MFKKVIHTISWSFRQGLLRLIRVYRWMKPVWGANRCRFFPSCSEYAQTALQDFGTMQGLYLIVKRLLRCHPFHPGGYDPVPSSTHREKMNRWT